MEPEPLPRSLANPLLEAAVDLGHRRADIGLAIARAREIEGGKNRDAEARTVQPIDARRRDRAIVAQGGLGGAGTVIAARPKNGTAMPSFNFWSINSAKFCPCRSA